jgi:hypothetical protein
MHCIKFIIIIIIINVKRNNNKFNAVHLFGAWHSDWYLCMSLNTLLSPSSYLNPPGFVYSQVVLNVCKFVSEDTRCLSLCHEELGGCV